MKDLLYLVCMYRVKLINIFLYNSHFQTICWDISECLLCSNKKAAYAFLRLYCFPLCFGIPYRPFYADTFLRYIVAKRVAKNFLWNAFSLKFVLWEALNKEESNKFEGIPLRQRRKKSWRIFVMESNAAEAGKIVIWCSICYF